MADFNPASTAASLCVYLLYGTKNKSLQSATISHQKRIQFKTLVLVHKATYEWQPVYLASLLNQHTPKRCLRSSSRLLLDVSRINLERFGPIAFAYASPTLWNNLPINLRVNGNHTQFKKLLKTCRFST